jgi:hypothetical protein
MKKLAAGPGLEIGQMAKEENKLHFRAIDVDYTGFCLVSAGLPI